MPELPPTPAPAASAPLPPVPPMPMPPPRVMERPKAVLSKFHLSTEEQAIQALADEVNNGLARVFDSIARLSAVTKPKIVALSAAERATWARNDGSPCDDAIAALGDLEAVLKKFSK